MLSAEIRIAANNVSFVGACDGGSVIQRRLNYTGRLISYASPGHSGLEIKGLTFDNGGTPLNNSDSSAVVYLHSGNHETYIHDNRFENLGAGRAISSGGSIVPPQHVRIEQNTFVGVRPSALITPDGAIRRSGVVTVTTTTRHGLWVGSQIYVSGMGDRSFEGLFTVKSVPNDFSFTYAQEMPDASSGGGSAVASNLRTISLVTPGMDVQIRKNTILGAGSITLEPSSEAADGDIEVSGNVLEDVDASNILIRTHDNTRVESVLVSNNRIRAAGLGAGKGCIVVGENAGTNASSAFLRHVQIVGNECRGWGNWTGPSIGISVAGATGGATVEDVVISSNVLDARRMDGSLTSSGYGIFIRNNTDGFEIENNRIAFTGRSCIATSFAHHGELTKNNCESAVSWSSALKPSPAQQGCYQIDRGSSFVSLTGNRCIGPGTASGLTNGFFVADTDTISSIWLRGNAVIKRKFVIRKYSIGPRAKQVHLLPF